MDVQDRCSDIILDASIWDNKCYGRNTWGFYSQIIELLNTLVKVFIIAFWKSVKRETTGKDVNNPISRRKFRISRIKWRKYFIELIVHVYYMALDNFALSFC